MNAEDFRYTKITSVTLGIPFESLRGEYVFSQVISVTVLSLALVALSLLTKNRSNVR